MRNPPEDRTLWELFARLKLADRSRLGRSASALAQARRKLARGEAPVRHVRLWGPASLSAVAAALVLAIFLYAGRSTSEVGAEDALELADQVSAWTAPTDSLLEVSELVLPRGVPSLELTSVALPDDSGATPPD